MSELPRAYNYEVVHLPISGRKTAKESLRKIQLGVDKNYVILEWITEDRFIKAVDLRLEFQDMLKILFTDLTSMVMMKELKIKDVLTEDDHFTQVGMGFKKVP